MQKTKTAEIDDKIRERRPAAKKYASSIDVAKLAGVSQSAVSRVFTEGASASAKTREKVLKAASVLGYGPSMIPKIMLTHRSSLIAIVSGGMYNPFYANVVERFAQKIQESRNNVMFFTVNHGEYIDGIIPYILSYRVDGIISALSIVSSDAAERCAKMNIPVVLLNGKRSNEWVTSVCSDNVAGGRQVASLFAQQGGNRFAYIAGKKGNLASEDRLAGYAGGLVERGVTDVKIEYGDFRYEGGYKAALKLREGKQKPDAIFCANDLMAIGAIEAVRSGLSLRVPQDVMIAGFDDIPAASWPSMRLTTVRQDAATLVSDALRLLYSMIQGDTTGSGALHLVSAPLIERNTTKRKTVAGPVGR